MLAQGQRARVVIVLAAFAFAGLVVLGASRLGAARAATPDPGFCETWTLYAACDLSSVDCYNNALNIAASTANFTGGGLHSNSGLHTTGASFSITPTLVEWGLAGVCTGNVCPPGGPAVQVPPVAMPAQYDWADFQPGGYWWNDMCQGAWAAKCHFIYGNIGTSDTISSGLWLVNGNVTTPHLLNLVDAHYTFVLSGNFVWNAAAPHWEPFAGSSAQGGSKAFVFSTAPDPGGVNVVNGTGTDVYWNGTIYVPYGLARISAAGGQYGHGGVYAWRAELSGATLSVTHDASYCPAVLPAVTASPTPAATGSSTPTPAATSTPTPAPTSAATPTSTATPTATSTPSCADAYEPNDTFDLAWPHPPATPPARLDLSAPFCAADVSDYYRVRLDQPGPIHVLLSAIPPGSDYGVYLYDAGQTYLYGAYIPGSATQEFWYGLPVPVPAGEYVVRVYAWGSPGETPYRLQVNAFERVFLPVLGNSY